MKVGDLVRMKKNIWQKLRPRRHDFGDLGLVYSVHGNGINVFWPNNRVQVGITDHYEVVIQLATK